MDALTTDLDVPPASAPSAARRIRWPLVALAAVAVAWVIAQFLVTFHVGIGWDETVYLSQYARDVPAGQFSAPRARGVPLIVAPLVAFTTSVPAIRTYLTLLSGVGLFTSFWPWLRVRPGYPVSLAAGLFASVWVAMFYGNEAMPDMFVAYGAVAALGLFLLAVRPGPRRAATLGLGAVTAFIALVRPSDSVWIAATLIVAAVAVRPWRRPGPVIAVVAGEVIGWGEWFVESFLYFGGPFARMHAAEAENETGLHFSLGQHINALSESSTLCRPDCSYTSRAVVLWFIAIPVAAIVGCLVARRTAHFRALVLAAVASGVFAGAYVVTVGYAAPRFLLPAYALAALPVAEAVGFLLTGVRKRARPLTTAIVVAGLLADLLLQARGLQHVMHRQDPSRTAIAAVAARLPHDGITPPCLLYGPTPAQVAFDAHCSTYTSHRYGHHGPAPRIQAALDRHQRVAIVERGRKLPAGYLAAWHRVDIVKSHEHWYFYLSPPTGTISHSANPHPLAPASSAAKRR